MGATYTEAQAKASAKYIGSLDEIKIRVPKGMKDEWKKAADEAGCTSMNQFIMNAVKNYTEEIKKKR